MLRDQNSDANQAEQQSAIEIDGMPMLKIGFVENRETIEFRSTGRFSVLNDQGLPILKDVTSPAKWRIKVTLRQSARYLFNIVLGKFQHPRDAHELEYALIEKGIGTQIKTRGGELYYGERVVNDNTQYWVVIEGLKTENEAQDFAQKNLAHFSYVITREKVSEPVALLELYDAEFEKLGETENIIRIVPDSHEAVTYIYDLSVDPENQQPSSRHRTLKGPLEFRSSGEGKVIIVAEMPLESYIAAVMSVDTKIDFPLELLKAQAVTIRSKTIAALGVKHSDDAYHLCSGSHCQPFLGSRQVPENLLQAVKETAGMVLWDGRQVVAANYTLVCGGHTEAAHILNQDEIDDPYPAIYDAPEPLLEEHALDLTQEEHLKQWVASEPAVCCNLSRLAGLQQSLMPLRRYFRWQVSFTRQELEEIITVNSGINIGFLYDILPIRHGISGRIFELDVLASHKNLTLIGEENIRRIFGPEGLFSSCFIIERHFDDDGFPTRFSFKGAGYGHGVGLCHAGGLALAQQQKDYTQILAHYFRNLTLKKIY
ncbi:MAG: SpoIID/LytB domain-containing protein [candidate division KSB1 bacterium]|nr:SpoIID/LytB domain-containing protein [candidate division KSB1 bacterium]MDZ7318485.1 SpoIID/LytB domain-containing protein [candidate division KSB1 bacterium]MDZ7340614.1 SpoIID/LytB domain-containing protein [candidate division KSB1 bacterium]